MVFKGIFTVSKKKIRLLTDSVPKKEQALARIEKESLIAERKKHQKKLKYYSDDAKVNVIKTFLALGGNTTLTAHACGIAPRTVFLWKNTDWWKQIYNDLRKQEKLELSAKAKNILDKSMEVLADRVANGDYIYDSKKGELVRKPINAQVAIKITTDLMERKAILDKETEEEAPKEAQNAGMLEHLAERFAKLATQALEKQTAKPPIEVTDVIFVEEIKNAPNENR